MAKVGDRVRFLNTTGGGVITRIEGKLAYIEEDGFETPVLLKDVVVVLPAGHEAQHKGANIMFDQQAFDKGKKTDDPAPLIKEPDPEPELPVEETDYGDKINIALAFEPRDVKNLASTVFNAVLVNDSNYFLDFIFLRRSSEEHGWTLAFKGTVAPNELMDIARLKHENLSEYEKIALQYVAYKQDKIFTLQSPAGIVRKLDLTKFHKYHCFRPGIYFENPVLEIQLVKEGMVTKLPEIDASRLEEAMQTPQKDKDLQRQLAQKYNVSQNKNKKTNPENNPHKLLPLIEVDLHIGELTDSLAGLEPKDMLDLQLDTVRKHMKAHSKRIGQKLVFIHGKGEGVLRKAVLDLLKKEYPKAELQDASFREYGFGATLVTIH